MSERSQQSKIERQDPSVFRLGFREALKIGRKIRKVSGRGARRWRDDPPGAPGCANAFGIARILEAIEDELGLYKLCRDRDDALPSSWKEKRALKALAQTVGPLEEHIDRLTFSKLRLCEELLCGAVTRRWERLSKTDPVAAEAKRALPVSTMLAVLRQPERYRRGLQAAAAGLIAKNLKKQPDPYLPQLFERLSNPFEQALGIKSTRTWNAYTGRHEGPYLELMACCLEPVRPDLANSPHALAKALDRHVISPRKAQSTASAPRGRQFGRA